ncbi:MAG: hypothetical protein JSR63_04000 [Proteobacteria bacterium]|nr:hypothetical protein [Pseudomonadota bacterium]
MEHARPQEVIAALRRGDVDAALDAGLMEMAGSGRLDHADLSSADRERILAAAAKLRFAWDARERYRARQQRLDDRARKRDARRTHAPSADGAVKPALPAAAANALAKALARAQGK